MDSDIATLSWTPYGPSVVYDVARGEVHDLRSGEAPCVATGVESPFCTDQAIPDVGRGFYYLVRASNACGSGPWRTAVEGAQPACP